MSWNIDHTELDNVLRQMGVKPNYSWLEETVTVTSGELPPGGSNGGFHEGKRRIVVYIQEQFGTIYKYHLTKCATMSMMQGLGRLKRYVKTNRKDGLFPIKRRTFFGRIEEDIVKLNVCKNCLAKVNWQNYGRLRWNPWKAQKIYHNFSLRNFLESEYKGTLFGEEPFGGAEPSSYPDNPSKKGYLGAPGETWSETSARTKKERGEKCDNKNCGKHKSDMTGKQKLDVHHKDGNIRNPSDGNLIVLCCCCHAQQHSHMRCKICGKCRNCCGH